MKTKIDPLMSKAQSLLSDTESLLQDIKDASGEDSSDEDRILSIQLILQYRLSCEDVLCFLLQMDQNLLYSLGIQPGLPAHINKDRLAYALGNEDLKQILNILAILTNSLSKIIARYKSTHASFSSKEKRLQQQNSLTKALTSLLHKQKEFAEVVEKLNDDIAELTTLQFEESKVLVKQKLLPEVLQKLESEAEHFTKLHSGELVYDYIASLRWPITNFYQHILRRLEYSQQFYRQLNSKPVVDYQLNVLLENAAHVLNTMPSIYHPHPNYQLKQFDPAPLLEERARAKRLRPW